MSGAPDSTGSGFCDCCSFDEGDWVECKLNTDLFGIVISSGDWERFYSVQLASTLETRTFHAATLRHMEPPSSHEEPPKDAADPLDGNVIDFTKARDLRKTTTTRGAA